MKNNKVKVGSHIQIVKTDGSIDPVVYTVFGTRKGKPVIQFFWDLIVVNNWVIVP